MQSYGKTTNIFVMCGSNQMQCKSQPVTILQSLTHYMYSDVHVDTNVLIDFHRCLKQHGQVFLRLWSGCQLGHTVLK